jgi:outer membrane lipoprotein carrier protein
MNVIQAVEAKYSKVQAMQADFVQTTRSEVFGEEKQSGQVVLKRPKQMLWNFTGGAKKQFVTDGKTMWIYTEDEKQVIRYDDVSASSSTADSLLQSLDSLDEIFVVDLVEAGPTHHILALQPRKDGAQVKHLNLELDPDYVVRTVTITDSFDNVTVLAFSAVHLNPEVPDSMFQFQPPAGVEVISASGH